jgi:hypothetical protein
VGSIATGLLIGMLIPGPGWFGQGWDRCAGDLLVLVVIAWLLLYILQLIRDLDHPFEPSDPDSLEAIQTHLRMSRAPLLSLSPAICAPSSDPRGGNP